MSKPNDGGPAFPVPMVPYRDGFTEVKEGGMSLRDWFAGQERLADWDNSDAVMQRAMAEALAGQPQPPNGWAGKTTAELIAMLRWEAEWKAALKYLRADAMMKAREKEVKS